MIPKESRFKRMLRAAIFCSAVAALAILLIEHHMDFLTDLVDEVVVLDSGKVIYRGDIEGMRCDRGVISAYLGEEDLAGA